MDDSNSDEAFNAAGAGAGAGAGAAGAAAGDVVADAGGVPIWGYAVALALVVAAFLWWRSKQRTSAEQGAHAKLLEEMASEVHGAHANTKEAKEEAMKAAAAIAKYQFTFKAER